MAINGLSRVLCMEQSKQVIEMRHRKSSTASAATAATTSNAQPLQPLVTIRPPQLPFNKWEPPPYQFRDSPVPDDSTATSPDAVPSETSVVAPTTAPNSNAWTYYRKYRVEDLEAAALFGSTTSSHEDHQRHQSHSVRPVQSQHPQQQSVKRVILSESTMRELEESNTEVEKDSVILGHNAKCVVNRRRV